MSKVQVNIRMSLDGYVAGPNQSEQDPLGIEGEQLHEWLVSLEAFRKTHGGEGGDVNASTPIAEEILGNVGATIMGRNIAIPFPPFGVSRCTWVPPAVRSRTRRTSGRAAQRRRRP